MKVNEKGRAFFEWATLIVELLAALATLATAIAEILRYLNA